jgi:hypothetical protein
LATKFTYKMRSGGKGMWGRGPALYKQKLFLKKLIYSGTTILLVPYKKGLSACM